MPAPQLTSGQTSGGPHRQITRRLNGLVTDVARHGHEWKDESDRHRGLSSRLAQWRHANVDYAGSSSAEAIKNGIALAGLGAELWMGVVLAGSVSAYFAEKFLGGWPLLKAAAPFVLPATIIGIELLLNAQRREAIEQRNRGAAFGWSVLAALMLLVMPTMSFAGQYAGTALAAHTPAFWARVIAVAALGLAMHAMTCYSSLLSGAFAYTMFRIGDRLLNARVDRLARVSRAHARRAFASFDLYVREREAWNSANPASPVPMASFDVDVVDALRTVQREQAPQGVAPPPASATADATAAPGTAAGATAPAPDVSTSAPPADSPRDGEVEFYRRVLERRIKDADAGVEPE